MANTTNLDLEKPLGTDKALVARLNSNSDKIDAWAGTTNQALLNINTDLGYANLGSNTLANIESAITSTVANMQDNTQKNIRFIVNPATGIFRYAVYIGTLIRINNSKWSIMVHADDTVQTIVGERYNNNYYWQELVRNSDLGTPVYINQTDAGITSTYTVRNCRICKVGCTVQIIAIVNNGDTVFPAGRFTLLKVGNSKLLPATTNLSFVTAGGTSINGLVNRYVTGLMNAANGEIYIDNIVTNDVKEIQINLTYICLNN